MRTSGSPVDAVLYVLVLILAARVARDAVGRPASWRDLPFGALAVWLPVAVCSVLQGLVPSLETQLRRDPFLINTGGQWWRIFTSALVQDGGFGGTVFNLVALAMVVLLAARVWGIPRMLIVLVCSQLIFNLLCTFVFPEVGAGNSGAALALATSIIGVVAVLEPRRRDLFLGAAVLVAGIVMMCLHDAHGEAVLIGLVVGAVAGVLSPPATLTTAR